MNREVPQATDEAQMRAFWRQWNKLITAEEAKREEQKEEVGRA
jgi:p-cumate 2,3-dioxygenase subunit alpha